MTEMFPEIGILDFYRGMLIEVSPGHILSPLSDYPDRYVKQDINRVVRFGCPLSFPWAMAKQKMQLVGIWVWTLCNWLPRSWLRGLESRSKCSQRIGRRGVGCNLSRLIQSVDSDKDCHGGLYFEGIEFETDRDRKDVGDGSRSEVGQTCLARDRPWPRSIFSVLVIRVYNLFLHCISHFPYATCASKISPPGVPDILPLKIMARTRERSPEPDVSAIPPHSKKLKTSHSSPVVSRVDTVPAHYPTPPSEGNVDSRILSENVVPHFANDLFDHNNITRLNSSYVESTPFKYAVVEKLFQDDLLKAVKDECLSELSFTEKETDIYKVLSLSPALSGDADSVDNEC